MKQLLQSYKEGTLELAEVPAPGPRGGHLLVETRASLVSAGTEKYMLEMARKSLLGKALARPDLVRQVIAKARTEGVLEAWRQAQSRLDAPVPLGYSSAGVVADVGPGVDGFAVGDRVACTGSNFAGHAEMASVPANLCTSIPASVSFEEAAFGALGGIALEAVRVAKVSLGETVAVIGLGLLGQIAVQILRAAGCQVVGMDLDPERAELARHHGADGVATHAGQLDAVVRHSTSGHGCDAVIILAATESNEPLEQAAEICRERGRVVAAGVVGLQVPRKPFFDKELELVVSRAWGPGATDLEQFGKRQEHPIAYPRWTAERNLSAFLAQLGRGAVRVSPLISHRFPLDRATDAYDLVLGKREPFLGVVLHYPEPAEGAARLRHVDLCTPEQDSSHPPPRPESSTVGVGLIGAGQFACGTLLPALKKCRDIRFCGVATATGLKARHAGKRFGFGYCTTDGADVIRDPQTSLVFVLTRHGSHASLLSEALRAGKHVFVEKPLALNQAQLEQVTESYAAATRAAGRAQASIPPQVMVGFNRRFSPFAQWLKTRFEPVVEPLAVHCTINAGPVPKDSWIYDPEEGGGRIVGELCHFVDLIQYLTGSQPVRVYAEPLRKTSYDSSDNVMVTLKMANGALGSITYVAGGDKAFPRERVEVFGGGAAGVIENFKSARFTRAGRTQVRRNWFHVDRGHQAEIETLLAAIRAGGPPPVPFEDYLWTTHATFAIEKSIRKGASVAIETVGPGAALSAQED